MKTIFKFIQIQIQNFRKILISENSIIDENFNDLQDIIPHRKEQLELFEDEVQINEEFKNYREFINSKNKLTG